MICFFHKWVSVVDVDHSRCGGCFMVPEKIYNEEVLKDHPKGYCPHSFRVCSKCGKEKGYGSHGELTVIPDSCEKQIKFMKEDL
jgi:hypothetical protein